MPPKSMSDREEMLNSLSKRIFLTMLDELIFDVALEAHQEVLRGKAICQICRTRCGSAHLPQSNATGQAGAGAASSSRGDTPSSEAGKGSGSGSVNGGTPGAGGGSGSKDGTVLLDCVVCQRQIASNRYAPHLASCMGLSSTRRAPARTSSSASGKPKLPSDAGRSASPTSEAGNASDDRVNGKGKAKVKSNLAEETEGSLKRKRPQSPQSSPAKVKKAKSSGSPVSRVKAEPDATGPLTSHYTPTPTSNKSKIPSRLRESSTTSFLDHSPSMSSRSSSPAATPASSAFSAATQSPNLSSRAITTHSHGQHSNGHVGTSGRGRGKATGTGPPSRRVAVSPPRPAQPPAMVHHSVVPDYDMHDGGNETGSSTDTDSD